MFNDSHVHVGYFTRKGSSMPFYYSPRRIIGVLNRCGVEEFIVSSTCAQIAGISVEDIVREAQEVKNLAGSRAHLFFWLSGHLYDDDRAMRWMKTGLFEGVKFHGGETSWIRNRERDLYEILKIVSNSGYCVQFHCGNINGCRVRDLLKVAVDFPTIHFDFAHCRPVNDVAVAISKLHNIWTDTAYMDKQDMQRLRDYDWHDRLMYGSDLPVWQAFEDVPLTKRYRDAAAVFKNVGFAAESVVSFTKYLAG